MAYAWNMNDEKYAHRLEIKDGIYRRALKGNQDVRMADLDTHRY